MSESLNMTTATATITRPANTTAYAALDAISDSTSTPTCITFANMAPEVGSNGGSGYIVKARMLTNQSTFTGRIRLHIYSTAPTAINDNSPFTLLWANRANRIGFITFPAAATEGTGSDSANAIAAPGTGNIALAFKCANGDQSLYALAETLDGFTPTSGQIFFFELQADSSLG
jgi:hypothetical protein